MRKNIIKIAIILSLIPLTISFTACEGKNKTADSNSSSVSSQVVANEENTDETNMAEEKDNDSQSTRGKDNYKENKANKSNSSKVNTKENYKENKTKPNKPAQKPKQNPSNKSEQYTSKNLGFTIDFPESWKGHYQVRESSDFLSVTFKPSKDPLSYEGEGVLFMILKKTPDLNEDAYDTIGSSKYFEAKGSTYFIGGPLDFPMKEKHPEVNKYKEMMKERYNVLKTIKAIK